MSCAAVLESLDDLDKIIKKQWGVLLILNPDESKTVIKTLMNPSTWVHVWGIDVECTDDRVCLCTDDGPFEFTTNGDDFGDFYYVAPDEERLTSKDTLFIAPIGDGTLKLAQRLADEIKNMKLSGIRFLMVAMDVCA
jgi:hypothetical protein